LSESALDRFFTRTDIRERHETTVHAPASVVYEAARSLDIGSLWQVQAIFRMRARMMRAKEGIMPSGRSFVDEALASGWGAMVERRGELFVAGSYCQPWVPDVLFHPLTAEEFADFSVPDQVKIAWTLEARGVDGERSRFITETFAVATDEEARRKFQRYLRMVKIGILAIRWLMVPAVRRAAERRYRMV
jgi:hypothetical protein